MDRILLINNGMKFQGYLFGKALSQYYEVSIVGNPSPTSYEYPMDEEWHKAHFIPVDKFKSEDVEDYDIILGLDHGATGIVAQMKLAYSHKLCGVQILDYPGHVFRSTKDFNPTALWRWTELYIPALQFLDFNLYNQKNSIYPLSKYVKKDSVNEFIRFPVKPIHFKEKKENLIVYSGRIHPDKGLHHVISALGLIEKEHRPKLLAIGDGFNFSDFANHLGVDYEQTICSEEKKWQYYAKSKAIVCGADNHYIPALCILEGISIGVPGICFNTTENTVHYEDYAYYANNLDLKEMANLIDFVFNKEGAYDPKKAIEFYEKECTYDVWADKVKEVIDGCKK